MIDLKLLIRVKGLKKENSEVVSQCLLSLLTANNSLSYQGRPMM